SGDNLLFGGGGNDTFVWKPADFGGTDTIADFQHDFTTNKGDVLRFDALFSDSDNQHNALDALLSQAKWDGDTHTIKAGEGPVTISMTLAADHAELTVTDHGATQNIILNGDFSHFDLQAMNDQAAQQLLHDIIKVTG
ncbi:MAG: hypothetical protein FWH34_05400, partial [Desulfovibrionaceae bacterium]|nr:hypothetical protein [Desulfovibrionaceae bacterium]